MEMSLKDEASQQRILITEGMVKGLMMITITNSEGKEFQIRPENLRRVANIFCEDIPVV